VNHYPFALARFFSKLLARKQAMGIIDFAVRVESVVSQGQHLVLG
jgi:hypothetical protein